MNSIEEALILVLAMGAVILFCRAIPFLLFPRDDIGERKKSKAMSIFLDFVEKVVPPAAMTVLAFNALGGAFFGDLSEGFLVLTASVFTALLHIWKKNFLISILGGTILYTLLIQI
jgi:branched-subunit amino acid transport protein AzlD